MLVVEVMRMPEELNSVALRGRVTSVPAGRELPSGTSIVSFRVSMAREATAMTRGSRQTSDWVDCVAWSGRVQRTVRTWNPGDVVEVEGSLRRRHYRDGAGVVTRLEVEVLGGRVVSRA